MTGSTNRAAVERGARREQWLLPPVVAVMTAAFVVVMSGRIPALLGPLGASVVLVVTAAVLGAVLVGARRPAQRQRAVESRRVNHALTAHADPGPDLRERADRQARHLAAVGWMGPVYPLLALNFLDDAPWERPALAVPAVAFLGAFFTGLAIWTVRAGRHARRWLADPPGPLRELPPPPRRLTLIRWCAVLGAASLCLGFLVGLVAELS